MKFLGLLYRWFGSILLLLGGLFYTVIGIVIVVAGLRAKSWPTATGTITSSTIIEHRGRGVSYSPEIHYRYLVNGATHKGNDIWIYGDFSAGEQSARAIAAMFPPEAHVSVFYSPSSPTHSVLLPGTNWYMFAISGIGLVAFATGLSICPVRKQLLRALLRRQERR